MAQIVTRVRGETQGVELYKKLTRIGSGADNDVIVDDERVEDTHLLISADGEELVATPAGRGCTVRVNGRKTKKQALQHNDVIEIGDSELFVYTAAVPWQAEVAASSDTDEASVVDAYHKVYEFSAKLLEKHRLADLLEELMDRIIGITQADKGFLLLFEGADIRVHVARNIQREIIDDAGEQLSDSIIRRVIREKRSLIVSDALHDADWSSSESVVNLKLCSVMCVPLMARGDLLGIIYVGNDRIANLFEPKHLDVLTVFASQASLVVQNALMLDELRTASTALQERLDAMKSGEIIGASGALEDILAKARKVSTTDIGVLIQGETGTGKELLARHIHEQSRRSKGPFVTINCGAIPENLLESELFGHVRGAFTGAVATRAGRFQAANGGTLFLDEIGEMPLNLQVKILRAIQEKVVVKVGDTRPERVDIRILAATNRNLEEQVKAGLFREDLFYRLNVVTLTLPPLRDRGEDVTVIGRFLLQKAAKEYGVKVKGFSPNAVIAMKKYHWPGNIRELENRVKKAVVLAEKPVIGPDDLALGEDDLPPILPLSDARERWQRHYINEVLARNSGNRTKTARDLGVDPRTIFRHLEKEGV